MPEVEELIEAGFTRIVIDLRRVEFLDSTGLHALLRAHARAQQDGWQLAIIPGPRAVQRIFEITGTIDRLPFTPVNDEASNSQISDGSPRLNRVKSRSSPLRLPEQTSSSGELAAAISNTVVRIYTEHHGRGPTKAKTYMFDDVVLTVMEDSAAPLERTLGQAGEQQLVSDIRKRVHGAIAEQLKGIVEELTGRRVRGFLSGSQLEPDVKCDVFLLESHIAGQDG